MSAALTLPYVWATAVDKPMQEPMDGTAFYRRRTENLLQRYLRASLAVGRVPSVVEVTAFRGRATSSRRKNFEDVVIFTVDVESCLTTLDADALKLVVKIALQEYTFAEIAEQLRQDVRTVARNYGKALDRLTKELMKKKLLLRDEK